mmetsp:Transcript_16427/g.29040  ORF Transcript_16427/g.29040 Transcript_16427/m.29040 type:complete len:215 (-) Transcript_16427:216-860(-)
MITRMGANRSHLFQSIQKLRGDCLNSGASFFVVVFIPPEPPGLPLWSISIHFFGFSFIGATAVLNQLRPCANPPCCFDPMPANGVDPVDVPAAVQEHGAHQRLEHVRHRLGRRVLAVQVEVRDALHDSGRVIEYILMYVKLFHCNDSQFPVRYMQRCHHGEVVRLAIRPLHVEIGHHEVLNDRITQELKPLVVVHFNLFFSFRGPETLLEAWMS